MTHTHPPTLGSEDPLCPLPGISFLRISAESDQEHWRGRMEELKQRNSLALRLQKGREQGGKASGFPASLTAWREGCCQFCLLPCWKKVEMTRGPPGRQPGTRNSIVLPPETGPFFGDPFSEIVLTLRKKGLSSWFGANSSPLVSWLSLPPWKRICTKEFPFSGLFYEQPHPQ